MPCQGHRKCAKHCWAWECALLWDFLAILTANVENNKQCIVTELSERQKQKWKNVKLHRIDYMLSKEARDIYFVEINPVYGMDQFKVLNQVLQ